MKCKNASWYAAVESVDRLCVDAMREDASIHLRYSALVDTVEDPHPVTRYCHFNEHICNTHTVRP